MIGKISLRLIVALSVAASFAALTACAPVTTDPAKSTTSSRSAASAVCPERSSKTKSLTIINHLNADIQMMVNSSKTNCENWSGSSIPAKYHGLIVKSGQTVELPLEFGTSYYPGDEWTSFFLLNNGVTLASMRFSIKGNDNDRSIAETGAFYLRAWDGTKWSDNGRVTLSQDGGYATFDHSNLTFTCKTQVAGCK